jgi:hypothetical protein
MSRGVRPGSLRTGRRARLKMPGGWATFEDLRSP